ncbi:Crp/Fnr family transcriptional regulator [Spirillospora sp. NPDC029432]|uniref:Crp/Fnr family transcriptional regulator n=1 Tax=Spirillospora sp. NPDC029432 TaxID=3154599 RepID=UPI003454D83E
MIDSDDARRLLDQYRTRWRSDGFLSGIGFLDVAAMLTRGTLRRCGEDEVLMSQGESGRSVFLLLDAVVKISTEEPGAPGTRPVLHAFRSSGDIVGEFAFLAGGQRCATVRTAKRDCVVVEVPFDGLEELVAANPELCLHIGASMVEKMRDQVRRRSEGPCRTQRRLLRALVELVERYGRETADGRILDVGMKQQELGSLVGAGRNVANSTLAELRSEGIIETQRAAILVLDMGRLRARAEL